MISLLLSVLCTSFLFIIFKLYEQFKVNTVHAIVVNYFTASATGILFTPETDYSKIIFQPWFSFSLLIGTMFIILFIIIAFSSQNYGIGVTSIANKMSLVIPVIAAVYLYNEDISFLKGTGIVLAMSGVVMCSVKFGQQAGSRKTKLLLLLVIFAGSGITDTLIKYTEYRYLDDSSYSAFSSALFFAPAIIGFFRVLYDIITRKAKFELRNILWGIFLGIPNYFALYFLIKALSSPGWESSVVYPLNNIGIVLFTTLSGYFLFREKFSVINITGIIASVTAIFLLYSS